MIHDLTTLQEQAAQAQPISPRRRPGPVGRWSKLWPVYAELRSRGFTIRQAVDWLIHKGAVPQDDRMKAQYGLPMVNTRRRREAEGPDARMTTRKRRRNRKRNKKTAAKARTQKQPTPPPPPLPPLTPNP